MHSANAPMCANNAKVQVHISNALAILALEEHTDTTLSKIQPTHQPLATKPVTLDTTNATTQVLPDLSSNTVQGDIVTAKRSLKPAALAAGLIDYHDKEFTNRIVQWSIRGVPIAYEGSRSPLISQNWPSAKKYSAAVQLSLDKDVKKGRKTGPFMCPPFENFVGSPMALSQKSALSANIESYTIFHGHRANQ